MEEVLKILEEIKNASGKAKQDILEKNKDNVLLKKVLFFVYNPYIVTGLSDKKINKHIDDNMIRNDEDILKIFDYLKDNHTGTDKDIYYIQSFIFSQPVEYQDIYKEIFTKNLKIGVTSTTINKVWKDLIPEYEVQQGYPLHKRIDKILDEDIILTQKFDGCFIKNTKITMADGSMKNIQDVKIGDTVLSYNEQSRKVEPQKVINVFNNGIKPASDWNRVHSSRFRQGYFSNICTTNHKFYTDESWTRSEDLDPREDIIFTVEKYPTNSQIGMLLGACLGDGSIMRDSCNSKNLRGSYPKKKADIDIIKKFQSCIKNLPQRTKIKEKTSGYGTEMVDLTFSGIITLPNYFYNNSNWLRAGLTFTREVCNNLTPLALAIYYIDDGSRIAGQNDGANVPNVRPRVCLSTYRHSKENIRNLIDTLKEKFNIIATIRQERPYKNETNTGLVVDIGADNTEKFFDLIAPYVPKSIRSRKLGMNVKWQDAPEIKWWEDNNSMLKLYPLKVDSVEFDFYKKHKTGYEAFDLEIENNHNYFANGILVHNCRMTARVEDGNVQLFSRQGQIYEGFTELEQELSTLPDGCYDGELIKDMDDSRGNNKNGLPQFLNIPNYRVPEKSIINLLYAPMPSKDLFKQTTSIVNSDEKEKKGIDFFIYDMFPIENFDKMETYNETAETRKKKISLLLSTTMGTTPHLKEAPILYSGKFDSILIDAMLKQVLLCKQEGLMINLKNSPYEFKRSNNLIKVKQMYPADLKIIGFEEGTGKNKGTLGALIVNYKGFPVKVGSGFTDAERIYTWEHKAELIGTIVTVQYFEETTNKKDNSLSLRFPVFKRISSETRRRKVITSKGND